jgi:hypothetical protein
MDQLTRNSVASPKSRRVAMSNIGETAKAATHMRNDARMPREFGMSSPPW